MGTRAETKGLRLPLLRLVLAMVLTRNALPGLLKVHESATLLVSEALLVVTG